MNGAAVHPDPAEYGDFNAAFYDELYPAVEPGLLDALRTLARSRPALELGIGTGRVALPLLRNGVDIHGIEASAAMVAQLRRRPGAETLPVTLGDFASTSLGGPYGLVFALMGTLRLLCTLDRWRGCFEQVSAGLSPDGLFVVEDHVERPDDEAVRWSNIPIETRSGPNRYRFHSRVFRSDHQDRLGLETGLVLVARWKDWYGTSCTLPERSGDRCISVYRRTTSIVT